MQTRHDNSIYNMYNISTTYDTLCLVTQQENHFNILKFCLQNPKGIIHYHAGLGLLKPASLNQCLPMGRCNKYWQ